MELLAPQFIVLVPVIIALVQILKKVGLNTRFAPLVALILGIAGAILLAGYNQISIFQGLIAGLSASGLFSGYKASKE